MKPLANRKILLIGIGFYDYEIAIAEEFKRLGAEVHVEDERCPAVRGKLAPLRRKLFPSSISEQARYLAAMLARVRSQGPFDYIVIIKGELLNETFLIALRTAQPDALLISYQWDSMARYPELVERQSLFDRVLTFDQADSATYPRFVLRPTFFRPEVVTAASTTSPSLDFCFVGWLHHDRLHQVEALRKQIRSLGLSAFFYLFTGARTCFQLKISGRGEDVHWRPMPFARYAEHVADCRVIVDLPHPQQAGLTMRAMEAVGTGKKLLTTEKNITLYKFYSPERVLVIDAKNPRIDPVLLAAPITPLPSELIESYSLRFWALDILGITTPGPFLSDAPLHPD